MKQLVAIVMVFYRRLSALKIIQSLQIMLFLEVLAVSYLKAVVILNIKVLRSRIIFKEIDSEHFFIVLNFLVNFIINNSCRNIVVSKESRKLDALSKILKTENA